MGAPSPHRGRRRLYRGPPWLWANLRSGFASFNQTAYADAPGYTERLRLFFHYSVGMLFSLRATGSGAWLLWRPLSVLLLIGFLGSLAVAVVLCLRRGGRSLAIALGVLAFPLLVAYSPASWFWQDGRYVGYVVPLFVLVLVFGCADLAGRLRAGRPERDVGTRALGRLLAVGLATALVVLSVANFAVFGNPHQSFFANFGAIRTARPRTRWPRWSRPGSATGTPTTGWRTASTS